jgi:type I restriction enzyme M protein
MRRITQEDINSVVWKACDTFRGLIDPAQYKDYILTMLFIKYVSDAHAHIKAAYMKKYNGDVERVQRAMMNERFVVPDHSTFDYLYEHRADANIGELINIALADLEDANRGKLSSEDGHIFRNIDFNTSNLGDPMDKGRRLRSLLVDISKLDLNPDHLANDDVIGNAYMYLIENFASQAGKKAGEFFTPKEVSMLLAKLTKSKPGARIYDPTCGSASLLIQAGMEVGSNNFSLYGQEANGSTWALAIMNMFLHGFDKANIRWGDTIRNPKHLEGDALMKFDTVVANPPFSLDKWGKIDDKDEEQGEVASIKNYDPATDKYNRFYRGIPPKSKGDWAFISHMLESAYEATGKVGVVVPHGVLFRSSTEGKIRTSTIKENLLEAVIGLPANLFFGTGIPAAILIFNKGKGANKDVLFIDASQGYVEGKNQNKLDEEQHIKPIVEMYEAFRAAKPLETEEGVVLKDKFAYRATLKEIQDNDYNLNIPRYVDTFEEEAEIDIAATQAEINRLKGELATVETKMNEYLKELGFEI